MSQKKLEKQTLDAYFGLDSTGDTVKERARTSKIIFVRSQDELVEFHEGTTGLKLTAVEVLEFYGLRAFEEIYDHGSCILVLGVNEPAMSLMTRRQQLGLTMDQLAERAGLDIDTIVDIEDCSTRSSIHDIKKVCDVMGFDWREVGTRVFSELTIS